MSSREPKPASTSIFRGAAVAPGDPVDALAHQAVVGAAVDRGYVNDEAAPRVGGELHVVGRTESPVGHLHHAGFGVGRTGLRLDCQPSTTAVPPEDDRPAPGHASASSTGLVPGATIRIGRPTFDRFCFSWSMPSAWHTVASSSGTDTGRSLIDTPSSLVAPITWPPLIPPPASTALNVLGQWSRPSGRPNFGVRPNSPIQTISVVSRRPLSFRSVIRDAHAGSTVWLRVRTCCALLACVSHPLRVTSTNGTPFSTSRRAKRHPCPNRLRPYLSRTSAFSSSRSNAFAAEERISRTAPS